MKKMTSAYANKLISKLNDDKEFWCDREREGNSYITSAGEEPVIPEYDYEEVTKTIAEIDRKILAIKHAINVSNCTNEVEVGNEKMTIDVILVKLAQLNKRKDTLDRMRKMLPKRRYISRSTGEPQYECLNYDVELVKRDYERIDSQIAEMQIALDKYNQTVEFDVDIEE